jgi:hypothetical protein
MVAIIFFEENAFGELLQPGEAEFSSPESSPSSRKKARVDDATATQHRQNYDENLRRDDLTEDDHGNIFIIDDDEFFEVAVQEKKRKAAAMLKAQREMLKDEEAFDEYTDGSSATMESYDEEVGSTFVDEATFDEEFTNTFW